MSWNSFADCSTSLLGLEAEVARIFQVALLLDHPVHLVPIYCWSYLNCLSLHLCFVEDLMDIRTVMYHRTSFAGFQDAYVCPMSPE